MEKLKINALDRRCGQSRDQNQLVTEIEVADAHDFFLEDSAVMLRTKEGPNRSMCLVLEKTDVVQMHEWLSAWRKEHNV